MYRDICHAFSSLSLCILGIYVACLNVSANAVSYVKGRSYGTSYLGVSISMHYTEALTSPIYISSCLWLVLVYLFRWPAPNHSTWHRSVQSPSNVRVNPLKDRICYDKYRYLSPVRINTIWTILTWLRDHCCLQSLYSLAYLTRSLLDCSNYTTQHNTSLCPCTTLFL